MTAALFLPDGRSFVPSDLARSPWSPDSLHGGPVAALMAGAIEAHEPGPFAMARLTLEIMRPVPVAPLTISTATIRPGKKVQLVEAVLRAGDSELCRAVALRVRETVVELPDYVQPGRAAPDLPADPGPEPFEVPWTAFHNRGVEMRYSAGSFEKMGPATVWIRLRQPVVAGTDPTPVQRAVAAADFGNGVSATLEFTRYLFINPDLTVYLHRPPEGEWVCLDAVTRPETSGVGLAQSALYDTRGEIGRSLQSLLIEPR